MAAKNTMGAKKKIFILCGHPDTASFSGMMVSAYRAGARRVRHAVRRMVSEINHGTADVMPLLKKFMGKFPELKNVQPMDLHGGNIYVTGGLNECVYPGLIAIGDAAMQINPLAGEGIRHSLHSGRMAAETIDQALSRNDISEKELAAYDKKWAAYTGKKWRLSYLIAEQLYGHLTKKQWRGIMKILSRLSPEGVIKAGFNFEFLKVMNFMDAVKALGVASASLVDITRRK